MCGIFGLLAKTTCKVKEDLLAGLRRLEYRGYDSVGFATTEGELQKDVGFIGNFMEGVPSIETKSAISHTRWATHGGVTVSNAHPFRYGEVVIVHNGIIENLKELKSACEGHEFSSETDSEIIAHLLDNALKEGKDMQQAISGLRSQLKGTYAVLAIHLGEHALYAIKKDSPLLLGIGDQAYYLASDMHAFSNRTDKAVFFKDMDVCVIRPEGYQFYDEGGPVDKEVTTVECIDAEPSKEPYEHYMLKEINEQQITTERLLESVAGAQNEKMARAKELILGARRVVFLACGSSYHASLLGVYLLNKQGIETHAIIASEFEGFTLVGESTLVIAVSQSGETMDVVTVLKDVKQKGAKILGIVNVPFSTIERLSDVCVNTVAGPEICVASTKVYTAQVVMMLELARLFGYECDISSIPTDIAKTIHENEAKVKETAQYLKDKHDVYVLGRGPMYPVAREVALKLKEIPYLHAEGMMAGELKHGTIALIEKGTPVITLIYDDNPDMVSNTEEVRSRGADIISISNTQGTFVIPGSTKTQFAINACIIGHLLSYYIAHMRGLPIDKPRNLAKSVTVK
ncbi:glutamine--fructose-6-phosphate transaminase (isomerizing) [Candidatus Woesearchaeota archaeon]|nr:glutamine--fructose-6-phosphate transaminase (isomerizing) [Candidatus Woesearchaeota archaeon]